MEYCTLDGSASADCEYEIQSFGGETTSDTSKAKERKIILTPINKCIYQRTALIQIYIYIYIFIYLYMRLLKNVLQRVLNTKRT
jgi:hypothetical protein